MRRLLVGLSMPRKTLIRSQTLPYHVTARANNCEPFPLGLSELWDIIGKECLNLTWVYGVEIHSFVLMPNHFHMLLTVPEFDLGKVMDIFMSTVTRSSHLKTGRSGRIFGNRYHWSIIQDTRYYGHAFKYVYRNPVKAELCARVEDYLFSTLHGQVGRAHLPFPLYSTRVGMEVGLPAFESEDQLSWLNRSFSVEVDNRIRKSLKRTEFKGWVDSRTRRSMEIVDPSV